MFMIFFLQKYCNMVVYHRFEHDYSKQFLMEGSFVMIVRLLPLQVPFGLYYMCEQKGVYKRVVEINHLEISYLYDICSSKIL